MIFLQYVCLYVYYLICNVITDRLWYRLPSDNKQPVNDVEEAQSVSSGEVTEVPEVPDAGGVDNNQEEQTDIQDNGRLNTKRRPNGCPYCDSSVYSYCSDKLLHDACCCLDPQGETNLNGYLSNLLIICREFGDWGKQRKHRRECFSFLEIIVLDKKLQGRRYTPVRMDDIKTTGTEENSENGPQQYNI